MLKRLKELYKNNKLNENDLNRAVALGWITEAKKEEILASK